MYENDTIRLYISFSVIIQVVMKNTGFYIVATKSSAMRADIQAIPFLVILFFLLIVTVVELLQDLL